MEHLLVILVELAEVDHLKVGNHLGVLIVQKSRESLVRQHRDEEHIEVLQSQPRPVPVVLVQQPVEVLLIRRRTDLKDDHDQEADQVSQNKNPVEQFIAGFEYLSDACPCERSCEHVALLSVIISVENTLGNGEDDPSADDADALSLQERVITGMSDAINEANQDKQADPVDQVVAEGVGECQLVEALVV